MDLLPDQPKAEHTETKEHALTVVGIGASAGGLVALTSFFDHLPINTGFAFIIVTHLSPDRPSLLPELLQKHTQLPIIIAENGLTLKANQVFICPEGQDLIVSNDQLKLMSNTQHIGTYRPIDHFLLSLAQSYQANSIGIILSGTGTDGTLGIQAIKEVGGITFAQDTHTANYDGMPSSAIASGDIDFVLTAADLGSQLLHYYQVRTDSKTAPRSRALIDTEALYQILQLLNKLLGHDFSEYKVGTLQRRIARRMSIHQLVNVQHYIQFLSDNHLEQQLLLQELLINVTSFFRDPEAFKALATTALPLLFADKDPNYQLRVWVTACANGQEAYSVAILFHEYCAKVNRPLNLQIFATDLDENCITTARIGRYPLSIKKELSEEYLSRYFTLENNEYRINKEIRETVTFAQQNLISDPPFTRIDLITCRNLLIYVNAELQKHLLCSFHYALNANGILFLGSAENIGTSTEFFKCLQPQWKIYQRRSYNKPTSLLPKLHTPFRSSRFLSALNTTLPDRRSATITLQIEHFLLDKYAPISLIVNESGKIFYIHGKASAYLETPMGQPNWNIFEMAKDGFRYPLAASLRLAVENTEHEIVSQPITVNNEGYSEQIIFHLESIDYPESLKKLFLISIFPCQADLELPEQNAITLPSPETLNEKDSLEYELFFIKKSLNTAINELEITNEELQFSNEELQSTNEELETTKEEMQALNEELSTINIELQHKIESLSESNDDMQNLLNGTDIASIFLSCDLHIKRFTRQAKNIFKLIDSDMGRPLADLVCNLRHEHLLDDAQQVLETLVIKEFEAQTLNNDWYLVRILPYRTTQNIIDGLAINFININKLKIAEMYMQEAILTTAIVNTVPQAMLVLDDQLCIRLVNPAYLKNYALNHEEFIGQSLFTIHKGAFNIVALHDLLKLILSHNQAFNDFQLEVQLAHIGIKQLLLTGCNLQLNTELPPHILLSINERPSP